MIDVSRLWVTEWIVLGFFAYLILLARVFPLSSRQRLRVLAVGLVCAGLAVMLSQLRLSPILRVARDWLPAIYLLQGYWLCGVFFRRPMLAVEQRLIDSDRALFRFTNLTAFLTRGPKLLLEYLELMYLLVYPLVPNQLRPVQLAGLPCLGRQLLGSHPARGVRMLRLAPVDPNAPTPEPRAREPVDRSKPLLPSAQTSSCSTGAVCRSICSPAAIHRSPWPPRSP